MTLPVVPPKIGKPPMVIDWEAADDELYWLLYEDLLAGAQLGGTAALVAAAQKGMIRGALNWGQINEAAVQWASEYAYGLVRQINDTTRSQLQAAISSFHATPGMTRGELERAILEGPGGITDLVSGKRYYTAAERAEMIAVTETTRSYSAGEVEALRAVDMPQVAPKQQPPLHVNCILPGNEVILPGKLTGAAKSFYRGRAIEITLSNGSILTVTENHPILTAQGWIRAQFLSEGDYVVVCAAAERVAATVYPYDEHRPAMIEQVYATLEMALQVPARGVPVSAVDFYGDERSIDGYVDIVRPNGFLRSHGKPSFEKPVDEFGFNRNGSKQGSGIGNGSEFGFVDTWDAGREWQHEPPLPERSVVRGHPEPLHALRFRLIPGGDPGSKQTFAECQSIDTSLASEFVLRFASNVASEQIVKVRDFDVATHVYDLQVDPYELYICNGVIVKNCRCDISPSRARMALCRGNGKR